jgi:hypothetical protein
MNKSIYNNYSTTDIEEFIIESKKLSPKNRKDYYSSLGLDMNIIEKYYPIVTNLNKLYYNETKFNILMNRFKIVILFMFHYVFL